MPNPIDETAIEEEQPSIAVGNDTFGSELADERSISRHSRMEEEEEEEEERERDEDGDQVARKLTKRNQKVCTPSPSTERYPCGPTIALVRALIRPLS